MKKTNKILIGIILISSLLLSIGYAAIQNITLDIKGEALASPSLKVLISGVNFNKQLKGSDDYWAVDTTITKIVFDYWENGYKEGETVIYRDSDWKKGSKIDLAQVGGIRLFKSSDGKTIYILSEAEIFANTNSMYMFCQFESLKEIVFNNFNTSNVEDMSRMFYRCISIESYDLSGFNTSNVKTMKYMFFDNYVLKKIDLSNFNTFNVKDMNGMFSYSGMTEVNIKGWNTTNVTDMNKMFIWCSKLVNINVEELETPNVTDMESMFENCQSLTQLDVSNFNTSKLKSLKRMFYKCQYLTSLDLSSFDTSNVTNMDGLFTGNIRLKTIYVSDKWSIKNVDHTSITIKYEPFENCTNLVGGAGTRFDSNKTDVQYARIDGGPDSETPGYLTLKTN